MKRIIALTALVAVVIWAHGRNISGDWSGKLDVRPDMSLKIVFHFTDSTVTLDSPDQGAYGIAGKLWHISADSVNVRIPSLSASFAGGLKDNCLTGVFKQGLRKFPLTLLPGIKKAVRPQTPVPPFPYRTEDLKIETAAGIVAGTLTMPENANKKTPLAVLITGSGSQNRDEELFEHKPFAVIADYLAHNGVATFRYDDRGIGESTGDVLSATTADFAADVSEIIAYFRRTAHFGRIGIIGHSEGGLISYMLGAKPRAVDFIVSIAGPSIKGSRIIAYQNKIALLKSGVPQSAAEDFERAIEKAFEYRLNNSGNITVTEQLLGEIYPQKDNDAVSKQLAGTLSGVLAPSSPSPWLDFFLAYDPADDLSKLRCKALIIYGGKDMQVPASLNADKARRLARKAVVKQFEQLNHLMQHADTGSVEEYKEIEETFAPEVLREISEFINSK